LFDVQVEKENQQMRKIVVNTFVSLDGVMQAPGGPTEDTSGGFELGGWSFNYWDNLMGQHMGLIMGKPFDLLLGRKTYDIFAAHWPLATDDPAAAPLNNATKYVVTTTLERADWQPAHLIKGDVVPQLQRLKEQDGPELQVHGSSNLLQTLIKHELIDQYNVWIFPVLLADGKRLFGSGVVPGGLRLVESQTSTTGVIIASYAPAGAITPGSFALDQPNA
jgi:dihydrofolate reductase